jgi:hypothetical protein
VRAHLTGKNAGFYEARIRSGPLLLGEWSYEDFSACSAEVLGVLRDLRFCGTKGEQNLEARRSRREDAEHAEKRAAASVCAR